MNNEASPLLLELHYLPLIHIFRLVKSSNSIAIQYDENYQKQTHRNRTHILTSNGIQTLIIPVRHDCRKITEVKIGYDQPWVKNHLKALETSYRHSAYFEYYYPHFQDVYNKKLPLLFDFNLELFNLCLKILKMAVKVTSDIQCYEQEYEFSDKKCSNIQLSDEMSSIPYRQVFGTGFTPNLSIIDLIFNMGPDSVFYL